MHLIKVGTEVCRLWPSRDRIQ